MSSTSSAQGSKLLRGFAALSAVIVSIVGLLLSFAHDRLAQQHLLALGERNNVALTQAFANSVWPQVSAFVGSVSTLTAHELRARPETAQIRASVIALMQGLDVVKVKIDDQQGCTVFSTEASQIGDDKSANAGYRQARAGTASSELTHRDTFSAFENMIEDRDVLSSYLPIRVGSNASVQGVFEIYADVTALLQRRQRTQQMVNLGVFVLLALLYAVLLSFVGRASRTIVREHSELEAFAQKKSQTIEVDALAEQDAVEVDAAHIKQVLRNLLGNAIKFAPQGSTIRVVTSASADGAITTAVHDAGPGIPADELDSIFDKFVQSSRTFHPDLVLLDVMMPGIDGFETFRRLRQDAETVDIKIVLVTAAATAADRQRAVDCGSDDFVAKPFGLAQMKLKVDSIVLEARGGETNAGLGER